MFSSRMHKASLSIFSINNMQCIYLHLLKYFLKAILPVMADAKMG